jgi:hypothetical protein
MGLEADLKDFSVSEILYLLSHFKKSGRLHVRGPEKEGEIFLLDGNAIHASSGSMSGVEAIYNLSLELSGNVSFDPRGETKERSVSEDADKLVAEGERRRVELKEVLTKLPPFETLLVRTPHPPEQTAITIRRSDWAILALVDGRRTIKMIVDESKLGMLEVLKALAWLISKGLILDPKAVDRALRDKVKVVNALILEYGGTDPEAQKPWIQFVEETMPACDLSGKVPKYLRFAYGLLGVSEGPKSDIAPEEVDAFIEKLVRKVNERAISEFGPILAKHKYQAVLKKLQNLEVAAQA